MEKTIKKRINNLLTRIGDEGPCYYLRDIEKLNTLTTTFLSDEIKRRYFLDKFRICLNKIPFKFHLCNLFHESTSKLRKIYGKNS